LRVFYQVAEAEFARSGPGCVCETHPFGTVTVIDQSIDRSEDR